MRSLLSIFLIIISASSLFSQENLRDKNNLRQGFWKFKQGKSLVECHYLNDTLQGSYKRFVKGRIREESNYIKGNLDGPYKLYWKNGKVMVDMTFTDGRPDGVHYAYDIKGKPWKFINYENGVFDGKYVLYYEGRKLYEANFVNGILDGDFFEYYPNGQVYISSIFRDGRMLSGERIYDKVGKLTALKLPNETRDRLITVIEYDENGKEKPIKKFINEKPVTYIYFGEGAHKSGKLVSRDQE